MTVHFGLETKPPIGPESRARLAAILIAGLMTGAYIAKLFIH